jgi:hypothetical protein
VKQCQTQITLRELIKQFRAVRVCRFRLYSFNCLCGEAIKRENSLLDNWIKANDDFIMGDKKALELEKTRLVHRCFKGYLKDALIRVLK